LIVNHVSCVAAAEPIPRFSYSTRLQGPLAPRTLNLQQQQQQQQQTFTLHLHCFQYRQQQHEQDSSSGSSDVLYLAVGAPLRCKAIPGNAAAASASAGSSSSRNSFGVLTWQPLPGAVGKSAAANNISSSSGSVAPLEFPVWLFAEEQEPWTVSNGWLLFHALH
jgi:hypothetical protein